MERDLLYKFFLHAADESERSEIRRWVEASPSNYETFMAERQLFDTATMLSDESLEIDTAASAPVAEEAARPRRRIWRYISGAAAAAVLALLAVGADRHFRPTEPTPEIPLHALTVPAGQRLKVNLSDGTQVWLNSNTTMRFPGMFASASRKVEIDGEAYFTVAKDAERPFTVNTRYGDVVVTGTEFNVEAYSTTDVFGLSLVEGSVRYERSDTCIYLSPGDKVSVTAGLLSRGNVAREELEWVHGIVSFADMPLRDILARFEKYYGVRVQFCLPEIADMRFTGKFYLEDGIEHALNTIRHDIGFSYETDRDLRNITIK